MLQSISINNFKSLHNIDVELRKLNIFIGPNNSGKSSILHSLLFFCQSYKTNNVNYSNPYKFDGFDAIITNKKTEKTISILLTHDIPAELKESYKILEFNHRNICTGFDIKKNGQYNVRSYLTNKHNDYEYLYERKSPYQSEFPYSSKIEKKLQDSYPGTIGGSSSGSPDEDWFKRYHHISVNRNTARSQPQGARILQALNKSMDELYDFYRDFFNKIIYIPDNRGDLHWFTSISGSMPEEINAGDSGHSLYNTLFHMTRREYSGTFAVIKHWAKEFGIDDLTPYLKEAEKPTCGVETLQKYSNQPFQLVSMGFGTRQVIFLLVKSIIAPAGSIILIEEPEIHLHPAYQVKVIDFLLEMVKENKQILITTHSEYLILPLQNAILSGFIDAQDVGIFYVQQKGGKTRIDELCFSDKGSYDLPGFYDVTQHQLNNWLQLKTEKKKEYLKKE